MPIWMQHILVLSLAVVCLLVAVREGLKSLRGKPGRLGSCCAKGCSGHQPSESPTERIVFLPSDMLRPRR